jgi:hypothetical protein
MDFDHSIPQNWRQVVVDILFLLFIFSDRGMVQNERFSNYFKNPRQPVTRDGILNKNRGDEIIMDCVIKIFKKYI